MKKLFSLLLGSTLLLPIATGCATTTSSPNNSSDDKTPAAGKTSNSAVSNVTWLHINKDSQSLTLDVTAGQTDDNNGFNFNGYSKGAMTVTVPLNWHVNIAFSNKSASMPHSLVMVPYDDRTSTGGFKPAFSGATTPQPEAGVTAGQMQHFTFTADRVGKYAMVCGVGEHASHGFWDTFVVSSTVTTPAVTINSASMSGSSQSTDGGY